MPDVAAMSSPASHLNEGAENYRCILVYVTPTENGGGGGGIWVVKRLRQAGIDSRGMWIIACETISVATPLASGQWRPSCDLKPLSRQSTICIVVARCHCYMEVLSSAAGCICHSNHACVVPAQRPHVAGACSTPRIWREPGSPPHLLLRLTCKTRVSPLELPC